MFQFHQPQKTKTAPKKGAKSTLNETVCHISCAPHVKSTRYGGNESFFVSIRTDLDFYSSTSHFHLSNQSSIITVPRIFLFVTPYNNGKKCIQRHAYSTFCREEV